MADVTGAPGPAAAASLLGIVIAARDEEQSLGPCLEGWQAAIAAWQSAGARPSPGGKASPTLNVPPLLVVLDDCRDRSAAVAAAHGASLLASTGGKVAALEAGRDELRRRALANGTSEPSGAFLVCADADVVPAPALLVALDEALQDLDVHVAFPSKSPYRPRRGSLLARSLYTYNARQGFASRRTWFSGQSFAIRARDLVFPSAAEIAARAARLPPDGFLRLETPLRTDDVYLSQALLHAHGLAAFRPVAAEIGYRGPETLGGMYRRYRRMQAELARVRLLFPELAPVQKAFGHRVSDLLASASRQERAHYYVVQAGVQLCRLGYWLEAFYHRHLTSRAPELWPPIPETKLNADDLPVWFTSSSGTPSLPDARCSAGATTPTSPVTSRT